MSQPTSFRLSDDALELLRLLEQEMGIKRTPVVEVALRDLAKSRGIELPKAPKPKSE